jgi:hypothetical protein
MGASARGEIDGIGEIWSLNNAYNTYANLQFDRFFEIHDIEYARRHKPNPQSHDHFTRLDMLGCPIYMQQAVPEIRMSRRYPLDDVCCFFGTNYFIGSPSYMLALALYEGVKHIRVYGFDQSDEQHAQQRSAWTFWLAKAQMMGVRVDGAHRWLGEWDVDAEGCMNAYRASAVPALKKAVEDKRMNKATIFVCGQGKPPQKKPPRQLVIESKEKDNGRRDD